MKAGKADFALALEEISGGKVDDALFTMALSRATGDNKKAVAMYLELRAKEIATERAVSTLRGVKASVDAYRQVAVEWYEHIIAVVLHTLLFIVPIGLLYSPTVYVLHVQDSMKWCVIIAIIFLCISIWLADIFVRRREARAKRT